MYAAINPFSHMPLWHVQYTNFFFYHFASSQVIPQFPKQNFD